MKTTKSGPCYSNVSLIKRALFQHKNGKLPFHEICLYVKLHWQNQTSQSLTTEKLVELALYAPKSFFQEDETGLWEVKRQIDNSLDFIISYMERIHRPIQAKELHKKLKIAYEINQLEQNLLSDIRFMQIQSTNYWMLSEWELINDLVYEYMQKQKIFSALQEEIQKVIFHEYQIDELNAIFAPEIDSRFRVNKKYVETDLSEDIDEPIQIEVPIEVKEEVARRSFEIIKYLYAKNDECKIKELVTDVFGVKAHEGKFAIYYEAVEMFLHTTTDFVCISKGRWVSNQAAASIDLIASPMESWKYAVHGSVPHIKNAELLRTLEVHDEVENRHEENQEKAHSQQSKITGYHTLSYYERVKGYFPVPKAFTEFLEQTERKIGVIQTKIEGFEYEWWWRKQDDTYFFYGDGVVDFFADYLIEVGQRLRLQWIDLENMKLDLLEQDERYATEQARYLDIGRLVEESKSVNKSIFTIMCEVLATYPSGIHWTTLLEKVNEIRSTTRNTIYDLLSKNSCFESIENKKGYWRLVLSKLSRYYIDEEDREVEQNATDDQEKEIEEQAEVITDVVDGYVETVTSERTVSENRSDNVYIDPYDHDTEYELLPLWETFYKWAIRQKNVRFQKAKETAKDKTELIEMITKSYSKLLTKLAKSRNTYSTPAMDLVQEGFMALLQAVDTYDHRLGGSFVYYIKQRIQNSMYRWIAENSHLIRIPVHMVENINKYEKLLTETLVTKGRVPHEEEMESLSISTNYESLKNYSYMRNIDYVSFEELWEKQQYDSGLLSDYFLVFSHAWFSSEIINHKLSNSYYEKTDEQLRDELDYVTDIVETDTESLWDTGSEAIVFKIDLRKRVEEVLRELPEKQENVIRLRFGLDDGQERTLEELGKIYGVSRERVRQIEKKAFKKLRTLATKRELNAFIDYEIRIEQLDNSEAEDEIVEEENSEVEKHKKEVDVEKEENITAITESEKTISTSADDFKKMNILRYLQDKKFEVIDNRAVGGALWVVGGLDLLPMFSKIETYGFLFKYSPNGGKSTKNRPAWWTK
ncbi:sigma-70 family RNA polymerase sigma factor [Brevibacillus nitrificans]|uniref:sigma-70 family RNA polymerase sigma factor n=1 Tax=Brevibacillus nitrificans TaxID=651560 RepID=UPI0028573037|nr:sigma-70 family RNA polymerase sigma factor [Brevibacillus nitrificans]MDR7316056.1 RNA polymerase primary sigma factor [Brevibacillus nitrificans]